jgi:hypothetical protein
MRRLAIATTGLALAAAAALPAVSSADDPAYAKYSQIRQDLNQCDLDTNWGQLSSGDRDDCDKLFADYVLFYVPDNSNTLYIHCRSSARCIDTPQGYPAKATDPIPDGSTVYDVQPRAKPTTTASSKPHGASHKRHRRHRH